jgi:hypothetical protein
VSTAGLTLGSNLVYAVVTNDTCSVTSRVATLTVLPGGVLASNTLGVMKVGEQTCLYWAGSGFLLERTERLGATPDQTVWTPVDAFMSSTNIYWLPGPAVSNAFYRLRK